MLTSVAPDDRVAIATYSRRPQLVLDFTADKSAARMALRSIDFRSGFGDLDLFSSVSTAIEELAAIPGKKTIVLLSTGLDTTPDADWQTLLAKLQTSDVRIISVSLSGDIRNPVRKKAFCGGTSGRALLKRLRQGDRSYTNCRWRRAGGVYFARNARASRKPMRRSPICSATNTVWRLRQPPSTKGTHLTRRSEVEIRVDHRPAYRGGGMLTDGNNLLAQ